MKKSYETYALLILPLLGFIYLIVAADFTAASTAKIQFIVLNFALFFYLFWEINRIAREERWRTLLHPAVVASIYHFMGSYFLPNLRYMSESNWWWLHRNLLFDRGDAFEYLNSAMWAILLAAFAMWRGYRSKLPRRFAVYLRHQLLQKKLIKISLVLNVPALIILGVASVGAILFQVKSGVFGYSSDAQSLLLDQSIGEWIKLFLDGGVLVLLILSIAVFSEKYRTKPEVWLMFLLMLTWQIFVGFISGFKSQVVMPLIIVGISYYLMRGYIPKKLILLSIIMVAVSYSVVEPFRNLLNNSVGLDNKSLSSITSTLFTAATLPKSTYLEGVSTLDKTLARLDLTTFTAHSIAFKDTKGLPPGSPNFLKDFLMAPVNAYVPRVLWPSKRVANIGYWYNVNLLGTNPSTRTAVAMGPVTYSYFVGGYLAVFIIFWILGFLQRICIDTFLYAGIGGAIIYLAIISPFFILKADIGAVLAGFLRTLPFVILAQYFLLKPRTDDFFLKPDLGR